MKHPSLITYPVGPFDAIVYLDRSKGDGTFDKPFICRTIAVALTRRNYTPRRHPSWHGSCGGRAYATPSKSLE